MDPEGFYRASVQRCASVEQGAVHHALAGPAHHQAWARPRGVEPVLQHAGYGGVGGDQVGEFVENEWTRPVRERRFGGDAFEERAPIRVFDVREPREAFSHGEGEVAALHGWRGSVRDRIEAIAAPRPLDQQARLANPPASPDGGESAGPIEDSVEPPHFFRAVEKLHRRTMQKNIMFCNILFRFVPQPNAQRRQGLAERLLRHFGNLRPVGHDRISHHVSCRQH